MDTDIFAGCLNKRVTQDVLWFLQKDLFKKLDLISQ